MRRCLGLGPGRPGLLGSGESCERRGMWQAQVTADVCCAADRRPLPCCKQVCHLRHGHEGVTESALRELLESQARALALFPFQLIIPPPSHSSLSTEACRLVTVLPCWRARLT